MTALGLFLAASILSWGALKHTIRAVDPESMYCRSVAFAQAIVLGVAAWSVWVGL